MSECGKRFIARTTLRTIGQYYQMLNPNAKLSLIAWNDEVRQLPWSYDSDLPEELMNCSGSSNVGALIDVLGNSGNEPVIILSDGYWNDSAGQFDKWASSFRENDFRVVLLGADANLKSAKKFAYAAEHLLSALEEFGE
ncbi:hypothetical protein [Collinsella sp. HCP28S3_E6]